MTDPIALQALAGGSAPEGNVIPYRAGFYQRPGTKGGIMLAIHLWRGWGKQDGRDLDISLSPEGEWLIVPTDFIERRFGWHACLDNVTVHPWEVWPGCSGDEIDEIEYRRLLVERYRAINFLPDSPFADPRKKVDWLTVRHDFSDLKGPQQ